MSTWRTRGVALLACIGAVLPGCATDQEADVRAYRAISDPPGEVPEMAAGGDLSMQGALRLTAFRNEQLAARGESYVQALAERQRAAASLRPTAELFSDLRLQENTGSSSVAELDAGLGGQYRVLTGVGDLRTAEAAEARVRSSMWLILDLREALLLQTARVYYETLRAERLVAVLKSSVEAQAERLRDAQARSDVGFARPLDVAQIEAQVSRTRAQLISAERQAQEGRAMLTLLTNAEIAGSPLTDGFETPGEERPVEELLAVAAAHRQDVLAARSEADAARLLVDAAISQYYPTITLNLDYFLVRTPGDSATSVLGLIEARVPVFSAGRIEADVRGAWSVFRERVLDFRLRAREMRRDVETAHVQLDASRRRASELRTQLQAARQALTLAEASYQAGLGTNLERVTAQDQLLAAELETVSEEYATKTAYVSLLRACGLLTSDLGGAVLPRVEPRELTAPDVPVLDRGAGRRAPAGGPPEEDAR